MPFRLLPAGRRSELVREGGGMSDENTSPEIPFANKFAPTALGQNQKRACTSHGRHTTTDQGFSRVVWHHNGVIARRQDDLAAILFLLVEQLVALRRIFQ